MCTYAHTKWKHAADANAHATKREWGKTKSRSASREQREVEPARPQEGRDAETSGFTNANGMQVTMDAAKKAINLVLNFCSSHIKEETSQTH